MRAPLKRFGAKATGWSKDNPLFSTTRLRLDILAGLVIILLICIFSLVIYQLFLIDLKELIGGQFADDINEDIIFESIKQAMLLRLLLVDAGLFMTSALILDFFIKKMLAPIAYVHKKQQQFADDLSHEIRTPLTVIQMYSELLATETSKTGKQYTDIIMQESKKMQLLAEDLLANSRIAYGANNTETISAQEFQRIAEEVFAKLRYLQQKNVQTSVMVNSQIRGIIGSRLDIERLLTNLVSNALKATVKGSVCISLDISQSTALLNVVDSGIGMTSLEIKKNTHRFQTTNTKGVGLGLPIVLEIARKNKWSVDIESEKNIGTTVKVGKILIEE